MPQVETTKRYLLSIRAEIMLYLDDVGLSGTDIGAVFNVDKSLVSRILANASSENILSGLALAKKRKSILSEK